jgi:hypothetical protein
LNLLPDRVAYSLIRKESLIKAFTNLSGHLSVGCTAIDDDDDDDDNNNNNNNQVTCRGLKPCPSY